MKQYPNDGKQHPTLSDWVHEVWGALPDGSSPTPFIVIALGLAGIYYPDWQTVVGTELVLIGIWGTMYLRSRSR